MEARDEAVEACAQLSIQPNTTRFSARLLPGLEGRKGIVHATGVETPVMTGRTPQ